MQGASFKGKARTCKGGPQTAQIPTESSDPHHAAAIPRTSGALPTIIPNP